MSEQVESVAENEEVATSDGALSPERPAGAIAPEPVASLNDVVDATNDDGDLTASDEPVASEAAAIETAAIETAAASVEEVSSSSAKAEQEPASEASEPSEDENSDGSPRVVKTLHVGQEVTGVVKRITDFGAFIDIGVGRDGLLHVSELSIQRIGKVTDVLSEGEEVTVWIKELDRKRNRISLTKIPPGTKTIRDLEKGEIVNGTVTRILPYGAFIDIGIGRDALLHVREMSNGFVEKPEDVVQVGEEIEARIVDISRRRSRVDLSLKGLRPEAEQEAPSNSQADSSDEADIEEVEDQFEDAVVLTAMELAFKRAMEGDGGKPEDQLDKRTDRKRSQTTSTQDEIIARTLEARS
ncbi:MAG: S1 RNA-binding domain-containing protein [Caldilineaceae bacterium]|nr:S1 RNA-binding domain-containing protein [Caldilineaceae bacterium]